MGGQSSTRRDGAPHLHTAIRGAIPRTELRAITAATYHQVWWPAHDHLLYGRERLPVWDTRESLYRSQHRGAAAELGPGM